MKKSAKEITMPKRILPLKGKRINYKVTHPFYGEDNVFDSWMVLCEMTLEIAEEQAKIRLMGQLRELTASIADEMINTAEEYEP